MLTLALSSFPIYQPEIIIQIKPRMRLTTRRARHASQAQNLRTTAPTPRSTTQLTIASYAARATTPTRKVAQAAAPALMERSHLLERLPAVVAQQVTSASEERPLLVPQEILVKAEAAAGPVKRTMAVREEQTKSRVAQDPINRTLPKLRAWLAPRGSTSRIRAKMLALIAPLVTFVLRGRSTPSHAEARHYFARLTQK